jgi:hypothetical protein
MSGILVLAIGMAFAFASWRQPTWVTIAKITAPMTAP